MAITHDEDKLNVEGWRKSDELESNLVEIVLAGEDGSVREHLCQDAADRPDVDRLGVALDMAVIDLV